MKQKIKPLISAVAVSCIALFLNMQRISAQAAPEKTAQAMIKALKDNHAMGTLIALSGDTLTSSEKIALGSGASQLVDSILAITGEYFSRTDKFQIIMQSHAFFLSRRPLISKKVSDYLLRVRTIGKESFDKWQIAHKNGDKSSFTPCLAFMAIIFSDFMFTGDQWKNGNPERILKRLSSLNENVVSKWRTAVGKSDEAFCSWALLAVDSLFVNDIFQQSVFDKAFPIAQKSLPIKY